MQAVSFLTLCLVISVASAAVPVPAEQAPSSNSGEYAFGQQQPQYYHQAPQHHHHQFQNHHHQFQPAPVDGIDPLTPKFYEPVPIGQAQNSVVSPVVGNSPVQVGPVVSSGPVASVEGQQSPAVVGVEPIQPGVGVPPQQVAPVHHHQQPQQQHHGAHPSQFASYYAPAGLIQVVGEQGPLSKPAPGGSAVRNYEQYGQPESAGIPPNYKPFGSWGLYIGGNPADGYYTNYYKALGNSVDKQQSGEPVKPASQTAAFSPILRQASSFGGSDFYPFAYSPSDLNSAGRVGVEPPVHSSIAQHVAASPSSAAQFNGAQVYGSPPSVAGFDSTTGYGVSPYADAYASKKVGAAYAQKEITKDVPVSPSKGYQSRVYVYPSVVASSPAGPLVAAAQPVAVPVPVHHQQHQHQQQAQVVAYPVPVGSQIVGSQQGVDGAFNPYGVHAFTRYAVKPTVVHQSDPSYYYGVHPSQLPAYKQQVAYSTPGQYQSHYPLSFYGYPVNQLHYSQGSIVPSSIHGEPHSHGPAQPVVGSVEASVEKVPEIDEKSVNKQQNKA